MKTLIRFEWRSGARIVLVVPWDEYMEEGYFFPGDDEYTSIMESACQADFHPIKDMLTQYEPSDPKLIYVVRME